MLCEAQIQFPLQSEFLKNTHSCAAKTEKERGQEKLSPTFPHSSPSENDFVSFPFCWKAPLIRQESRDSRARSRWEWERHSFASRRARGKREKGKGKRIGLSGGGGDWSSAGAAEQKPTHCRVRDRWLHRKRTSFLVAGARTWRKKKVRSEWTMCQKWMCDFSPFFVCVAIDFSRTHTYIIYNTRRRTGKTRPLAVKKLKSRGICIFVKINERNACNARLSLSGQLGGGHFLCQRLKWDVLLKPTWGACGLFICLLSHKSAAPPLPERAKSSFFPPAHLFCACVCD